MEEQIRKPRRPDYVGNIRCSMWVNGDYASLHIGDMKIRLQKNEGMKFEEAKTEEPKIEMEDVK